MPRAHRPLSARKASHDQFALLLFRVGWRQVQADSKDFKPWGNRTYAETVRVKDRFPDLFRILAEMDPQSLGGNVPPLELYDLQTDPDEMRNLAGDPAARPDRDLLYAALRQWARDTADSAIQPPPLPRE